MALPVGLVHLLVVFAIRIGNEVLRLAIANVGNKCRLELLPLVSVDEQIAKVVALSEGCAFGRRWEGLELSLEA